MTLPECKTSRLFRGTSDIVSTVQSIDPLTSNRKTIMMEFQITFFRLVAGLRCPVVLGPRSTYGPALWFGAQNICPPSERISNQSVYRCWYAIGHLLAPYRAEGRILELNGTNMTRFTYLKPPKNALSLVFSGDARTAFLWLRAIRGPWWWTCFLAWIGTNVCKEWMDGGCLECYSTIVWLV
jgi:hypothetical protein